MQSMSIVAAGVPLSMLLAACASTNAENQGTAVEASVRVPGARAMEQAIATQVDIPFTKFVLENGLTLIVHEDHKAPIVAVNVWYHVGSKNEKPGKTGFAHLFEHLMFQGSENLQRRVLRAAREGRRHRHERHDQRRSHQLLPDRAEERRSISRCGSSPTAWGTSSGRSTRPSSMSSAASCRTRSARARTSPTARPADILAAATVPAGHPYSWNVIGSMDDLNAASLEDVKEWFRSYYGPANATLVVAGDIDDERGEGARSRSTSATSRPARRSRDPRRGSRR